MRGARAQWLWTLVPRGGPRPGQQEAPVPEPTVPSPRAPRPRRAPARPASPAVHLGGEGRRLAVVIERLLAAQAVVVNDVPSDGPEEVGHFIPHQPGLARTRLCPHRPPGSHLWTGGHAGSEGTGAEERSAVVPRQPRCGRTEATATERGDPSGSRSASRRGAGGCRGTQWGVPTGLRDTPRMDVGGHEALGPGPAPSLAPRRAPPGPPCGPKSAAAAGLGVRGACASVFTQMHAFGQKF